VAWTSSGSTAFRIARERPEPPILALTPNRETGRRLALVWGVHALVTEDAHDIADMAKRACRNANIEGFAEAGDRIIIVAGVPFGTPGATNMVRIAYIDA
jgi:pyruvate kinase